MIYIYYDVNGIVLGVLPVENSTIFGDAMVLAHNSSVEEKKWIGKQVSNNVLVDRTVANERKQDEINRWENVKNARNELLSKTDWTQLTDSPIPAELKAEFATYRQALRDLPQSTDNPDKIVWPVKP